MKQETERSQQLEAGIEIAIELFFYVCMDCRCKGKNRTAFFDCAQQKWNYFNWEFLILFWAWTISKPKLFMKRVTMMIGHDASGNALHLLSRTCCPVFKQAETPHASTGVCLLSNLR